MGKRKNTPDIIINTWFYEFGKKAPKNSSFKGMLDHDSMFGESGMLAYTSDEKATENSLDKSVLNYTKREKAISQSALNENYFTMSSSGALKSESDYQKFREDNKEAFSKEGHFAWEFILSLKDKSVLEKYSVKDQIDFAMIISSAMPKIARSMNIDIDNLIYWQDYHTNTDHPHIHVTMMQKETKRERAYFTKAELKKLKSIMINEILTRENGEVKEQMAKIDVSQSKVIDKIKMMNFSTFQQIQNLYLDLPETSRLQYNATSMIDYRGRLDKIVDELLKHEDVENYYKDFIETTKRYEDNINDKINADVTSLFKKEDEKLRVQIANKILQDFKNYNKDELVKLRKWRQEKSLNSLKDYLANKNVMYKALIDTAENGEIDKAFSRTNYIKNEEVKGLLTSYLILKYDDDFIAKQQAESILLALQQQGNKASIDYFKIRNFYPKNYSAAFKKFKATKRNERLIKYISNVAIKEHQRELDEALWNYLHQEDRQRYY